MFKIYDGREYFYQWDLDRKLIVEDETINQVHFCNRTDDNSLVCEVYQENGMYVVDVPNILLQTNWRINVYGYDINYTKYSERFDVIARTKPADYVYTETEVINYNSLLERINDIENNIDEVVKDYLEENPVEVDLTGYATEKYVDDAIKEIPQPDLSGYATETYVDNAVAAIPKTDLTGYATEKYVDEKIGSIELPQTDLSNYYNKDEVNALIPSTSGFITMADVEDKGYQTEEDVNALINTALGVIENGTY